MIFIDTLILQNISLQIKFRWKWVSNCKSNSISVSIGLRSDPGYSANEKDDQSKLATVCYNKTKQFTHFMHDKSSTYIIKQHHAKPDLKCLFVT